ncbi:aldehyde dehydrogenase family protein [Hymenobacter chitinivorans]|uniref:Acyl-CoA reductase-like NAD-dependent aldehyde dehydrogenase n=1 Tax=Hymenobacter chitinivorans DSM 11115 TaxID=1121954 RepID=A0A2M9BS50_9BACT|nr:aldehyde dehydrogenase family protein [Hymenobacter chitinivorans]PJJ60790.1 acyl-CoA reductase-like NAD-dependent aldehyde dehydrogenase [Hymenobacter chitinivorans DSM 11115]
MPKIISPAVEFGSLLNQVKQITPEIFTPDGKFQNLMEGRWQEPGTPREFTSPIDGTQLGWMPMLNRETALKAVQFAKGEAAAWAGTDLDERRSKVQECLNQLRPHVELVGKLLMWEIGKTYKLGFTDIDRAIEGVQWYVDNIEEMLGSRKPLGLVSNIASWNYPHSVLLHAVLVQALCGNSVIAKTPTDGGFISLSFAFAIARRCGLPVTLVSGGGGELSEVLVKNEAVDCLSFVGGRYNGRNIADALSQEHKRYMLEMEGVNTYGIWDYSDWNSLADQLKKGYDYGKQRCTAYVRFVVQRSLFPQFLETYWEAVKSLKVGNPTLVDNPGDKLPELAFGPVINKAQAEDLDRLYDNALKTGATPIFQGKLDESLFLPGQDMSAYRAPRALVNLPRQSELYFKEPFGPIDSIVLVDRVEELVGEMNISNGALVGALASDDEKWAQRTAKEVRAFKMGVNKLRSRGDREEVFGGLGESWKGAFVGGKLLVEAVTEGAPAQPVLGNYPEATLLPEKI